MRITAIDFETANRDPASVCSVGIAVMEDGVLTDTYYSLIRPEANVGFFSSWNTKIHGITKSDVKDAPEFAEVYEQMKPFFENSLVCAHNARFDMGCLKAACLNTGRRIPYIRYFDTVELSRKAFPSLAHHRLDDMCGYLGIELDHHNALSDALGCLQIAVNIMNLTGIFDPEEMLENCGTRIYEL